MTSSTGARTAVETLQRLAGTRVHHTDADAAAQLIADASRVQGYLDAFVAEVSGHIDLLHRSGKSADSQTIHRQHGKASRHDAKRKQRRAEAVSRTPALGAALASGSIAAGHVDAIANAAQRLPVQRRDELLANVDGLLGVAADQSVERFTSTLGREVELLDEQAKIEEFVRQQRATKLTKWIDPHDGMYKLSAQFDPITGARIFKMVDDELESLWRAEHPTYGDLPLPSAGVAVQNLAAHALVGLCSRGNVTAAADTEDICGGARRGSAEVLMLIDFETIVAGLRRHSVCELADGTGITTATARRLACDAEVVPIVLGGEGQVLDVGRGYRTATRAQRRALRAMYSGCAVEHCGTPFAQCQMHHVKPWQVGGLTDLGNLIPLCHRHHHLAHEGGWKFVLDTERILHISRADGTHHQSSPLPCSARTRARNNTRRTARPADRTADGLNNDGGNRPLGRPDRRSDPADAGQRSDHERTSGTLAAAVPSPGGPDHPTHGVR